jgi:hypothetical protein
LSRPLPLNNLVALGARSPLFLQSVMPASIREEFVIVELSHGVAQHQQPVDCRLLVRRALHDLDEPDKAPENKKKKEGGWVSVSCWHGVRLGRTLFADAFCCDQVRNSLSHPYRVERVVGRFWEQGLQAVEALVGRLFSRLCQLGSKAHDDIALLPVTAHAVMAAAQRKEANLARGLGTL